MDNLIGELQKIYGSDATFRRDQREAIWSVLDGDRTLVVEKTGWGKSLVYFIATKVLRRNKKGITIVISPLIALMSNQIEQAKRAGLRAHTMNSNNKEEWTSIKDELSSNMVDLLFISPEHLCNQEFIEDFISGQIGQIGFFVVDEAHCISDWGHDFRPEYRKIVDIVQMLPKNVPVLATTATANDRVVLDIRSQLGLNMNVIRGPLSRESLSIEIFKLHTKAERLAWISENIERLEGTGILYCLTISDCILVEAWLRDRDIACARYDGKMEPLERVNSERQFMNNEIKVLVATVAFGMGIDKKDISFVIHFQKPASLVGYYQQIGRAGRGIKKAYAILLVGTEDDEINKYFIESAFPTENEMMEIVECCTLHSGIGLYELEKDTKMRHGKLEKCLKYLVIEGAIYKQGSKYFKSANCWKPDLERAQKITQLRKYELSRMDEFINTRDCYMKFIARDLNDTTASACHKCSNCTGSSHFKEVSQQSIEKANYFLKNQYYIIQPRKKWPVGIQVDGKNKIKPEYCMSSGLVLSNYSDCLYGRLVHDCKYIEGEFSKELVEASCKRLGQFIAKERISWVTYVPSIKHPDLVKNFAKKIALHFNLPMKESIKKLRGAVEQKGLSNSYQQYQNAENSFQCLDIKENGNVLLIDDMVDSRWTLTVCSYKLLRKGVSAVYPFALSNTAGSSGGE